MFRSFTCLAALLLLCSRATSAFDTAVQIPLQDQFSISESRDRHTWLACRVIEGHLPGAVSYPGDSDYTSQQKHYWLRQQTLLQPICRVSPSTAEDIPIILNEISVFNVPFALKSGGHSFVTNVSNVDHGLTIDLEKLNSIEGDRRAVRVGPGARWRKVYEILDDVGLSVVGAKAGDVGVGGFLLGGGNSWFSGRAGWACDNIESLEVVLVNGSIIEVSNKSHPDLFKALKGGGGNFGIVTRFSLRVHEQKKVLANSISYSEDTIDDVFQALEDFNSHAAEDPDSSVLASIIFTAPENFYTSVTVVQTQGDKNSPQMKRFKTVPHIYSRSKHVRMSTLASWADEGGGPYTEHKVTLTTKNSAALLRSCFQTFKSLMHPSELLRDIHYRTAFSIQPLTVEHLDAGGTSNGGNVLGLSGAEGPLFLLSLETRHSNTSRSAHHTHTLQSFITQCATTAAAMNLSHPFVYLNYASAEQAGDVFRGYGNQSLQLLKAVRGDVDPGGVFGRLKAGPFRF